MRDPYEVLEIKRGASKEEIKSAYIKLVKKYHPDQYRDNPLGELAEEKLKEVNEAYDYLGKNNSDNGTNSSWNKDQSWNNQSSDSVFNQVAASINNGNLDLAEQMLNQSNNHTAQWYYLKGVIYQRKGWYSDALSHIQTAVNMEPNNPEYRDALNTMNLSNNVYRQRSGSRNNRETDMCDMCQCMICTDCCCECFGSDLISCC